MKSYLPNQILKYGINIISCSLIVGCATAPPTQEMSDARQSVEAAESIGAETHAPIALDSAQHLLSRAQNDLEAGDFEEAQRDAIAARQAAKQAVIISQAKQIHADEQAKPKKPAPAKPASRPTPVAAPESMTYVVNKNDSLWKIAAKNSVYGDPWLWPLILKNNINQIKTADFISPGLVLNIDKKPSPTDVNTAIQYAKQRGHVSAQQLDSSYLGQYGLR
ncbi:MAG TPA: DUF4398 domain-containing protein [Candidatus Tenderia electrophaga]|uniref:DUF4398 domain-containing protein n=1 Tax=Candidatus Tenderia electrophaga TaxID=1748243 RepID=A0A832N5T8_9GAMM|nr:DUF4398 domain-containing protein [Candidatus Tenderia electrophaga]